MIHSARFGGASTLARAVVELSSSPGVVVGYVLAPKEATTEDAYWAQVNYTLRGRLASTPRPTGTPRTAFASVLECLTDQKGPVVLVLDDVHLVTDPVARVDELLACAPAGGLRIVATTRSAGDWPIRLARHPGQKMIPPESIRFSPDEVAALLRASHTEFDVRSPEIIHHASEGIPKLVKAACTSVPVSELKNPIHLRENVEAAIDREVDRVLTSDVELRDHRLHVLLTAAAVPLTTDSAMPHPDERGDPSALLALLVHSGLADAGGSPTNPRLRYPDVVRASLLRIVERENANALKQFRVALARRWLDLGKPDRALHVAAELRNWPLAVQIMREYLPVLYSRDYATTMSEEILRRIPEEYLSDDPALLGLRAMHDQFSAPRDVPVASSRRDGTTRRPAVGIDADSAPQSPDAAMVRLDDPVRTLIRAIELRVAGHFDDSAHLCDALVDRTIPHLESMTADDRGALAFRCVHIGISYIMVGRFAESNGLMRWAAKIAAQPLVQRDVAGKLALVSALLGESAEARGHLADERRHPALPPATEALVRPAGDVAAALVALDELDFATAFHVLQNLGPPTDREEFWGFVLYAWGQLFLANGAPARGLRFLDTQLPRFATMQGHGAVVGPLLDALRADLYLANDQTMAASHAVEGAAHPLTAATRARVLLLRDDPRAALTLAREALADPLTSTRHALELELVAAAASLALGDRAAASRHVAAATGLYTMAGLQLPFRSLPQHVMDRLATLGHELPVDPGAPIPEFGALTFLTEIEPTFEPSEGGPEDALLARLTDREHAVLRALATGDTIKQIAVRDFVSANTIKSQVRSVYRKLGVSDRASALRAAKRASLL